MSVDMKARARPTIGIILLSGISDRVTRMPGATSAGFAYTGVDKEIYAETRLYSKEGASEAFLNGQAIDSNSARSPFKAISKYSTEILSKHGLDPVEDALSISSNNYGILSGSSDAGAAATGKCIAELLEREIDYVKFENELRGISETAGRSWYGGLTITQKDEEVGARTEKLLDESEFKDHVIVGCSFKASARISADSIHDGMASHRNYPERVKIAKERGLQLIKLAENKDIEGIFDFAEKDMYEWHKLLEDVGIRLMTDEMRAYMKAVKEMRARFWNRYLVASGCNVFVFVRKENADRIIEEASMYNSVPTPLKVAGGAWLA